MNNARLNRIMPAVIVALLAALVAVTALYVSDKAGVLPSTHFGGARHVQKIYHWKMVTTWPKDFPGLGTTPEKFARWVEKASNGRLKITVYGAGEMVPAKEVFDTVSRGAAQMGHGAAYYWKGKLPVAPFFTTVPFGFNAQEMNAWLYYGGGMKLWRKAYAPFNLVPLAAGNTGVQMAGWFNKEIKSVADLKGLKMRIPGLAGEVFSRAGGTAVSMPGGEIFTSLQTGVIDATEWVGPYNDLAFGFYKVAKYYYYPGWHEPGPTLEMIVNKDAWNSLPPDLQEIVTIAARAANEDMLDQYTALNNRALTELVEKHHVKLRRLPDSVLLKLKQVTRQIMEENAAKDPQFREAYASFRSFYKQVSAYDRISEEAYYHAREVGEKPADLNPAGQRQQQ